MTEWTLPRSTSASQLVGYSMCPRKYALTYLLGVAPAFRSTALVLGSTVGSAIAWWFEERIAGRRPALDDALRVFEADFQAETIGEPVRWRDKAPPDVEAQGKALVTLYLQAHGDLPVVEVERAFRIEASDPRDTGECLTRPLKGYFDLVLEDGTVVELKTSSRSWRGQELGRHLQLGAYAAALHAESGGEPAELRVHVVVKTKSPRIEEYTVHRTEAANQWWFDAALAIEQAIGAGHFPAAPGPLCPECEHAQACLRWGELVGDARRLPLVVGDADASDGRFADAVGT